MSRNPVKSTRIVVAKQAFHSKFNDPAGDVVLSSNEGTLFRMPSLTLRMTSGLLSLFLTDNDNSSTPHHHHNSDSPLDAISLPFNDTPIERVLSLVSAQTTDPWASFEELESAIDVMEYLDTPGPLSFVRASCFIPIFSKEPIRLYGIGARFGWEDVLQYAAELTLDMNLFPSASYPTTSSEVASMTGSPDNTSIRLDEIENQLTKLPATHLYRLLKLHRHRRDTFRALITSSSNFSVGNAAQANCPCGTEINNSSWRELRSRLVWEMDQNPSGKTVVAMEAEEFDESVRCWKAKCPRCGSLCYNRLETMKNIRACVEQLPKDL